MDKLRIEIPKMNLFIKHKFLRCNGAVHYANALLHYTSYTDIIAIGITGYKDENGKLLYSMGVYYVSRSNYGVGQKIDDYTDLSFLKTENFDSLLKNKKFATIT